MLTIAFSSFAPACVGLMVSAMPIEAYVVDQSGAPLADVAVLARWQLQGGMEGVNPVGELMLLETTTDGTGRFAFPGWGPKPIPIEAHLYNYDPSLYLFKSGYKFLELYNESRLSNDHESKPVRSSEWSGRRITMVRADADLAAYARTIDLGPAIGIHTIVTREGKCEWTQMPIMLSRLNKERLRLEQLGYHPLLPRPEIYSNQKRCGSAAEWLQRMGN